MRPTTTILLSEMADRLTEDLDLEDPIQHMTPYDWWKRNKKGDLSLAMPTPIRYVGRSPVFLWRDIKRWYVAFKDLTLEPDGRVRGAKERAAQGRPEMAPRAPR
jgi:hypothetical protein